MLGVTALSVLVLLTLPVSTAAARDWPVVGGGDGFRSGFNPDEKTPYFVRNGAAALQPKPKWITKISDLPSGVFIMGGTMVADGKVYVTGASTNTILALDQDTGLPVWRFSPDSRGSKNLPGDGYTGAYTATNAPRWVNGVVYASFSNGTVYALDGDNGHKLWRWEVPDPGGPKEVTDHTLPADVEWNYFNPEHRANPLRREVAPFTGDYPKLHSVVDECHGRVHVETLDGRLFSIDARDGTTIWHRYAGAPDWPGEFNYPDNEVGGLTPNLGRPTRRFEARPGPGCLGQYLFLPTEDGFVKLFDEKTGRFLGAYDFFHAGDLGFVHDSGGGLAIPSNTTANQSDGIDLVVNSVNNRMVRINVPEMTPQWRHDEGDTGQLSLCVDRSDRATCSVLPTTFGATSDGPIGGGVFGGNLSVDYDAGVIANANQDGHLYMWTDVDVTGQDPPLIPNPDGSGIGTWTNAPNPQSIPNPPKDSLSHYLPRDGKNGPWESRTSVLSSSVMGGGVVYYNAAWEHAMYGIQYLDAAGEILPTPKLVFKYTLERDADFRYPPFGDTYPEDIVDLDRLFMGSPALADGHLYTTSFDGQVYAFDLQNPVARTQKNLAILGSGLVPFVPKWTEPLGTFDRVWTDDEWYKNQDPINGNPDYRLPAGLLPFGLPGVALAVWARRRIARAPAPVTGRSPVDLRPPDLDLPRGTRWR
ncbi:MAG: PQQ-binding-like beta-propeller repeat protein [Actinomycetota bacterium]